ncbi:hypothetical protein [Sanguibacter sp. 25GB23B1]|uniref:hypothetical protein n=1 Tax=unclassified Sanguibacter TaxID=2645534 RepID=UPI0032B01FBD
MSQWESPVPQGSPTTSPTPSGSQSRRRPAITALVGAGVALAVVGALALSGVFAGDGDDAPDPRASAGAGSTPSASTTPSAEPTPEEDVPGVTIGTDENPYGPGDSFVMLDDWTITLGATDTDTWPDLEPGLRETWPDQIEQFQPAAGMVYVSAPANVTYTGDPAGLDRIESIVVEHVAADGTVSAINTCGDFGLAVDTFHPIDLDKEPVVEGVACVEVSPAQAADGRWRVFVDWIRPDGQGDYVEVFYTAG